MEYALEDKRPSSASAIMQEDTVDYEETQIEVPQLLETIENGLKYLCVYLISELLLIYSPLQIKCHARFAIT